MLFNSYAFLLGFLPVVLAGFFVLARRSEYLAAAWLALASLFFYGWWDYRYVPLLLASIGFNYWCGFRIGHATQPRRRRWLVFAVVANLALLGYFKYADFFLSSVNGLAGAQFPLLGIVLPIGISFFTFTQIAFLADTYQGKVNEYRFTHYMLFVTYFPHLIAGPVLHHKEMMPQFADKRTYEPVPMNFAVGATVFVIGLAKKVLIADNLAPYAADLFDKGPAAPGLLQAWGGTLAYAFQLYFDFSGYSDMAIGLSLLFGVRLPLNFDSPYKSASIVEFWRRWHMTLSRFLRDYLYVPLGGNRHGTFRRYLNLGITMLLGGLWHGAGWNFVVWGGLHGLYLMINHAWAAASARVGWPTGAQGWRCCSIALTFVAVCFAWVFFRATEFTTAVAIVKGMCGLNGVQLPDAVGDRLGALRSVAGTWGISFHLGGGARFVETWMWIGIGAVLAFALPNSQQITRRFRPALGVNARTAGDGGWAASRLTWRPTRAWALAIGFAALLSLLSLNRPSEFLYFQF